ncbi:NUDIX domain-containing protein [Paenibacillus sp. UMB4589-SE434]|uniref:NUDIX hydrolase n=1 Tax=Paenibacillus sp. UMB4589-SE434 TaxID=3046314 RepID=UPI002550D807|nr:NUDIX domain-containing protein [Paenibacillus sp. UMB4589-SE434]MDK8181006.1 NUDIX domain-containing protein [Paenibacillus sp. UMB4589-SE434]
MKEISAGGVVYRTRSEQLEIQLIQDRYGKVSLAKGKMEPGETIEQTALREIVEETGIRGRIVAPINVIHYQYEHAEHGTVDKEVHYYLVEAEEGELQAQVEEIRGVNWYNPDEAWQLQQESGYDNNDDIVHGAFSLLGIRI